MADIKVIHDVVGQPARVEIHDLDNPQSIKRFSLEKGDSKTVSITGLKCKVSVFTKGANKLMVEGEFTPNQSVSIQSSGTGWVLKRVSR